MLVEGRIVFGFDICPNNAYGCRTSGSMLVNSVIVPAPTTTQIVSILRVNNRARQRTSKSMSNRVSIAPRANGSAVAQSNPALANTTI